MIKRQSPGTVDAVRGAKVGVGTKEGNLTKNHPTPPPVPPQAATLTRQKRITFRPEDRLPERLRSPKLSIEIAEGLRKAIAELKAIGTRPTPLAIAIKVSGPLKFNVRGLTRDITTLAEDLQPLQYHQEDYMNRHDRRAAAARAKYLDDAIAEYIKQDGDRCSICHANFINGGRSYGGIANRTAAFVGECCKLKMQLITMAGVYVAAPYTHLMQDADPNNISSANEIENAIAHWQSKLSLFKN